MIKVDSLIKDFFQRYAPHAEREILTWTSIWKRVTGKNIEKCTMVVALKKGTLFVEVEDSVWLYQLTLLKKKIIDDFNRLYGEKIIKEIVFRSRGFSLKNSDKCRKTSFSPAKKDFSLPKQKITGVQLSAEETAAIEEMVRGVPDPLKEKVYQLLRSFYQFQQWKKKQGAETCSRCRACFFTSELQGTNEILCGECRREINIFHNDFKV